MPSLQSPVDRCQTGLTKLPVEIILEIVSYVSPAASPQDVWDNTPFRDGTCDLKNLAVSCKTLYDTLQPMLYARSQHDDWYALRWGAFHGSIQTMEDAVAAGAPLDYTYEDTDDYHTSNYCRCGRFERVPVSSHSSQICTLFHEKKPVRSAGTPLLTAIRGGQPKAVDWLLSKGANPNYATQTGIGLGGAFCRSCARKSGSSGGYLSCIGTCGVTPMQGALDYFTHSSFGGSLLKTEDARIKVLGSLLAYGADVNQEFGFIDCPHYDRHLRSLPQQHWNPLGLAVFTQTVGPETVKFLLDNGARFETGTESLFMPVLAHLSHCGIALISWRVPVDLPLYDCESKARVLLSERHEAHENCHCFPSYDSLNSLGERDCGRISWDDQTPYSGKRVKKVFQFLRELELPLLTSHLDSVESKQISPLMKAIRALTPETVKLLIGYGEDPNARCSLGIWPWHQNSAQTIDGHNALTFACAMVEDSPPQPQIVLELLRGGANPLLRNSRGHTALHELARNNFDATTGKLLLDYGANPNALDGNGWAPLHHLCSSTKRPTRFRNCHFPNMVGRGRMPLADLLLSRGADLGVRTREDSGPGMSPCQLALQNRMTVLADRLLEEEFKRGDRTLRSVFAPADVTKPDYTGAGYLDYWGDFDD